MSTLPVDVRSSSARLPLNWWGLGLRFLLAVATLLGLNILSPVIFMPVFALFEQNESVLLVLQFLRYAVVLAGTVGLVALWMRLIERRPLRDAGWTVSLRGFGWLAVGVGASVAILGVLFALDAMTELGLFEVNADYAGMVDSAPLWAVMMILFGMAFLLQGIPEELLWRGWLFEIVRHRPWLAFWWTTLSFAAIHLVSSGGQEHWYEFLSYLLIPLGFGALAGAGVLTTGSMWIAAGVHAGFHVGNYLALLLVGQVLASSSFAHVVIALAFAIPTAVVLVRWSRARNTGSR
ncbi:MAG: lysostaphin resistance A-like protein [Micrococcaceae bacterium]